MLTPLLQSNIGTKNYESVYEDVQTAVRLIRGMVWYGKGLIIISIPLPSSYYDFRYSRKLFSTVFTHSLTEKPNAANDQLILALDLLGTFQYLYGLLDEVSK